MADINQDVAGKKLNAEFEKREMVEIFHEKFGDNLPPTCSGSKTIDGIFISKDLRVKKCGYLGYGDALFSDHRALWADLEVAQVFGLRPPLVMHISARRLTLTQPKVLKRYLNLWKQFVATHKLVEKAKSLQSSCSGSLSKSHEISYERLDRLRTEGR